MAARSARPIDRRSERALRLLVALALSREECAAALEVLGGPGAASDWRGGALVDALLATASLTLDGSERLQELLATHLGAAARRYRGRAPFELAQLWARERPRLRGKALAALLFTAMTGEGVPMRKLEERLTEEIEALAIGGLSIPVCAPTETRKEETVKRGDCQRETLAYGPLCAVEVCACGSLHVTIGALTLRFTPEAAGVLTATLVAAMQQLGLRDVDERTSLRLVAGCAVASKSGVS